MPSSRGIGSISSYKKTGLRLLRNMIPTLGPCISQSSQHTPSTPFATIGEYFKWLVKVKMQSATVGKEKSDIEAASHVLKNLQLHLFNEFTRFDDSLLRSVPSHEDLHAHNVFVGNTGHITGIIDWEFHMIKPAVLAAAYPSWIRYDGTNDPQFVDKGGQFSSFWFASRAEAARLRRVYDSVVNFYKTTSSNVTDDVPLTPQIVSKADPEYYRALKEGQMCREAEDWLKDDRPDVGCRRLQEWFDTL
jgi:hypothetical protein